MRSSISFIFLNSYLKEQILKHYITEKSLMQGTRDFILLVSILIKFHDSFNGILMGLTLPV